MSAVPKKKLCWQCEGSIDRDLDNCPYCGVYINPSEDEENTSWPPAFALRLLSKKNKESTPDSTSSLKSSAHKSSNEPLPLFESDALDQIKKEIIPMTLLFMGACFFLFGAVLLLFSQDGALTLQWKSDYAFYFLLIGIPAFIFGCYSLNE